MSNLPPIALARIAALQEQIEAQNTLEGIKRAELLRSKYSVRFRFIDINTGYHYYEVEKVNTTHRYQVKVRYAKFAPARMFEVISGYCQCPRYQKENNCHHLLLAILSQAETDEMLQFFEWNKFYCYDLAKVYRKELEVA